MKKSEIVKLRCSPKQKARIKGLARIYARGNVSEMVLDWVLNGRPRFVPQQKKAVR